MQMKAVIPQPYNPAEAINIMEAASRTEAHQLQRRGYARLIERAIAEEMKLGTSREDISILRPADRNTRLLKHMHDLRLIPKCEKLPDRAFRQFFNGR
jgi:hypothetical protein